MRWRASSDTDSNNATESYSIRHESPYLDADTNRCAGAANADAADTSGSNANCDAHAHSNARRVSDADGATSARVA